MIWALEDWDAMTRRIFSEVWVTMRTACGWPARITPAWHTSRPLGLRYSRPTIRSWLGSDHRPPIDSSDYRLDIP